MAKATAYVIQGSPKYVVMDYNSWTDFKREHIEPKPVIEYFDEVATMSDESWEKLHELFKKN